MAVMEHLLHLFSRKEVKTRRSPDGIATRLLRWRQQQEGTQPAIYTGSDKVRLKNCALSKLSFSALPYLCLR